MNNLDNQINRMDWLVPGYKDFIEPDHDYVDPPKGFGSTEIVILDKSQDYAVYVRTDDGLINALQGDEQEDE